MRLPQLFNWSDFSPQEDAVILFVIANGRILLIHKKRGLGHGKVNGPGGRVDPGETTMEAAIRETREEVGLTTSDLAERAVLQFIFTDGYSLEVTVFTTQTWSGTLMETDEALPFWCDLSEIPYDSMWADDRHWLPLVLNGSYVRAQFTFDEDEMLESDVVEVPAEG